MLCYLKNENCSNNVTKQAQSIWSDDDYSRMIVLIWSKSIQTSIDFGVSSNQIYISYSHYYKKLKKKSLSLMS